MTTTASSQPLKRSAAAKLLGFTAANVEDLNDVSAFLSSPSYTFTTGNQDGAVYVIAGSAILPIAAAVFNHLERSSGPAVLVIAGGIGHSTSYLYEAVERHPKYSALSSRIQGLSEADVTRLILMKYWPALARQIEEGDITLYIDSLSTNCGANAVESKRILDSQGIWPKQIHIIQDPTMHRRTLHCFDKIYAEDSRSIEHGMPALLPWTFFPKMSLSDDGTLVWDVDDPVLGPVEDHELWTPERFISLALGEIPRMRDDASGYGPNGAGFITHVDIPERVEDAWARLKRAVDDKDR